MSSEQRQLTCYKMYCIIPMSRCASPEKQRTFLDLLRPIAETTLDNEPQTLAYAWFEHIDDDSGVPDHWVRGFEMYETVEASTETHRSSPEYKEMRRVAGESNIFEKPSDLRYLQPIASSFLRREGAGSAVLQASRPPSAATPVYIAVEEWKPSGGQRSRLNEVIVELIGHAHESPDSVDGFLALKYLEQYDDPSIITVAVHQSESRRQRWSSESVPDALRDKLTSLCEWSRRTQWKSAGIGFVGRD